MLEVCMKFKIFKNTAGQYYWVLYAANGEAIGLAGEYYVKKSDCSHGIDLVKGTTSASQYDVYQDTKNEWRWRLKATNGQIIAASSEGYVNKHGADRGVALAVSTNSNTPVEDTTT
jgi:uncharacterized protein